MWHFNEDSYEKRRQKSLFYTTVEAETLLQKTFVFDCGISRSCLFWSLLRGTFCSLGSVTGLRAQILAFEGMASTFDAYAIAWDQQNRIARAEIESRFASLED